MAKDVFRVARPRAQHRSGRASDKRPRHADSMAGTRTLSRYCANLLVELPVANGVRSKEVHSSIGGGAVVEPMATAGPGTTLWWSRWSPDCALPQFPLRRGSPTTGFTPVEA